MCIFILFIFYRNNGGVCMIWDTDLFFVEPGINIENSDEKEKLLDYHHSSRSAVTHLIVSRQSWTLHNAAAAALQLYVDGEHRAAASVTSELSGFYLTLLKNVGHRVVRIFTRF